MLLNAFLLFFGASSYVAAQLTLSDRGCTANETKHLGNISYTIRNTTSSLKTIGFPLAGISGPNASTQNPETSWTWYTGIQQIPGDVTIQQPFWVDTFGEDLSKKQGYELCYMMTTRHSQSIQMKAAGDSGDCKTMFSSQCVSDWETVLSQQAFRNDSKGRSPCEVAANQTPQSCVEFGGGVVSSGYLPSPSRNCTFGQGNPDYDLVALAATLQNSSTVNEVYDKLVTRTVPLFVLGWNYNNMDYQQFAKPLIMCLKGNAETTDGSRKTTSVPSAAGRLHLESSTSWAVLGCMILGLVFNVAV